MRQEVRQFAELMEQRLRENDHKPGWKNDSPLSLAKRIREEYLELLDAIAPYDSGAGDPIVMCGDVLGECADIANFAMMVADVTGALYPPPLQSWPDAGRYELAEQRIAELEAELVQKVAHADESPWVYLIKIEAQRQAIEQLESERDAARRAAAAWKRAAKKWWALCLTGNLTGFLNAWFALMKREKARRRIETEW